MLLFQWLPSSRSFSSWGPRHNLPTLPGPDAGSQCGQGLGGRREGAGEGFRWGVKGHRADEGGWESRRQLGKEGRPGPRGATLARPGRPRRASALAAAPRQSRAAGQQPPPGRPPPAGAARSPTGHFWKGGLPRLCLGGRREGARPAVLGHVGCEAASEAALRGAGGGGGDSPAALAFRHTRAGGLSLTRCFSACSSTPGSI